MVETLCITGNCSWRGPAGGSATLEEPNAVSGEDGQKIKVEQIMKDLHSRFPNGQYQNLIQTELRKKRSFRLDKRLKF